MSGFSIQLQSATQSERLDRVVSFVGEDASGSFGLMRGHTRFVTTLVFALARLRFEDGHREYLALPEAVADFDNNRLTISTRRYLRSVDYSRISQALREELLQEEVTLSGFRRSIEQLEQTMLLRLWRIGRGAGRGG
ncbi:F0F1 ATP synthase subunit epsilon [Sedimenticola hydrogenitrophicus]|uniref:F0F1 ATP synthase subunit epsilon n=1 Tax=Sedimenticola hydrogenitrophicus TaxID=2967975 RepID=UPI0021A33A86|nr:F0F1 ATP synthase subunit epsilon [Sedimenticola hydrogenitrophicus]